MGSLSLATQLAALPSSQGESPLASMGSSASTTSSRPYVSRIGILPTSLPDYHRALLEHQNFDEPGDLPEITDEPQPARTPAEQEEASRRLRPHSRSLLK